MHRSASHKKQVQRKLNGIFYWKCQFHIRLFLLQRSSFHGNSKKSCTSFLLFVGLTWRVAPWTWYLDYWLFSIPMQVPNASFNTVQCPVLIFKFLFLNRFMSHSKPWFGFGLVPETEVWLNTLTKNIGFSIPGRENREPLVCNIQPW